MILTISKLSPEFIQNNQKQVLQLINSISASNVGQWDLKKLQSIYNKNPFLYSYIATEGDLVGLVLAYFKEPTVLYIRRTCVAANYRGKGVGKMLLAALLAAVTSRISVVVETGEQNVAACRLYETMGFTVTGSSVLDTGEKLLEYTYKK